MTPLSSALTRREEQVVRLAHLPNKEIATRLGIRPGTVRNQMQSAMEKLGVHTRTEAALVVRHLEAA